MDSQSIDISVPRGTPADEAWPQRVDWRAGKVVYSRDAEYWRAHERRRIDQGLTDSLFSMPDHHTGADEA
ncbi:MAG: hypothetical protein ACO305_18650 [Rubrivivax sp.]|jgi:hypothetical protein